MWRSRTVSYREAPVYPSTIRATIAGNGGVPQSAGGLMAPLPRPEGKTVVTPYDRQFTTIINRGAQIRTGFSTDRGNVTRFFVQLEYWIDGTWREVVRFDHDPEAETGHDITEEGLHMDIYCKGEKHRVKDDFPPVELNRAPRYCTSYIRDHAERLVRRFEQWHNVNDANR